MKEFNVTTKEKLRQLDPVVLCCVFGMNLLSLVTLFGAKGPLGSGFFVKQTVASVLGIIVMFVFAFIDYDKIIKRYVKWFFVASIVLMLAVIFFGIGLNGNKNWIRIPGVPFDIQPSEFVKVFFIITFSRHIKLVKGEINKIKNVLALGVHAGVICALVLATGDLGSTLVYLFIMAVMLLVGGLSIWYFIAVGAILLLSSPVWWQLLSEKQQLRIIYGFYPEGDPQYIGFQALRSRSAIASGGFTGSGLFGGSVYANLPQRESDFIFAVVSEKFGFFGGFFYFVLMTVLIIRLLWIARIARKDYGAYICAGAAALFIFQTLENVGMCLAMLPVIGITLPFLSYGGSSILAMYMLIGLVQSIKSHNKKYFFEREKA